MSDKNTTALQNAVASFDKYVSSIVKFDHETLQTMLKEIFDAYFAEVGIENPEYRIAMVPVDDSPDCEEWTLEVDTDDPKIAKLADGILSNIFNEDEDQCDCCEDGVCDIPGLS